MGIGSSFKKTFRKTIGSGLGGALGIDSSYTRDRMASIGRPNSTPEQIATANLFRNLSPEQQKDLLLNNPNIEGPGGKQIYDPLTNTVRIEESEFQAGQRGRQEALARSLSEQ